MLSVKLLGIVLTTLMLVNVATCWFETCSTNQTLPAGGSLTISSPYYPNYRYPSGSSCLYFVQAPLDYAIQVSCSLNVDQTTNCASQTFYISRDGEKSLAGAEFFCGSGSVARTTVSNELYFGYTSNNDGKSGYFSCVLTTVSIGPTSGNCDCGWSFNVRLIH